MGPAILGHAPAEVTATVARALESGQLLAGQTRLELELARRLQQFVPGAERVRIGMTGSEMVQAALRVARAATGRAKVVKFAGHYHGWFDNILAGPAAEPGAALDGGAAPLSAGQAPSALIDTIVLPWNDLEAISACLLRRSGEIAAVIMEAIMCNTGVIPPSVGYLQGVRDLCSRHGVVLIVDEVITGFRLGLAGAQGHFQVCGDLAVFAKAIGGGFPIAALTGRRDLMELIGSGQVNHSGTYNSNIVSLSAALATLAALAAHEGAAYQRIERTGYALMQGIGEVAARTGRNLLVQGYPSVFMTCFTDQLKVTSLADYQRTDEPLLKRFMDALTARGVRPTYRGTWIVSAAHGEAEVEQTVRVVRDCL